MGLKSLELSTCCGCCFGALAALHGELEWSAANELRYGSATNALSADQPGGAGFANSHAQSLQIRFEFAPGNAGDFRTHAA